MPRREEKPEQPEGSEEKQPEGSEERQPEGIPDEELEGERAGPLPDREALSVLGADVAIPLDPSIAAEVLSGEPEPPVEEAQTQEADAVEADDDAEEEGDQA